MSESRRLVELPVSLANSSDGNLGDHDAAEHRPVGRVPNRTSAYVARGQIRPDKALKPANQP